ncbi:hypothetical protein SADUNF_Sadunf16G0206600 [Salix dunnii]|uniref:Uncharacterized protein n=1 Tax=Salix dunnii TaxID=1413687 RepID=A0A835MH26_9ROSI|nr:hypothetical protein SADUNF_Sadunf16G0206600 [Salix dunnii]
MQQLFTDTTATAYRGSQLNGPIPSRHMEVADVPLEHAKSETSPVEKDEHNPDLQQQGHAGWRERGRAQHSLQAKGQEARSRNGHFIID